MDYFLYDRDRRHERVILIFQISTQYLEVSEISMMELFCESQY